LYGLINWIHVTLLLFAWPSHRVALSIQLGCFVCWFCRVPRLVSQAVGSVTLASLHARCDLQQYLQLSPVVCSSTFFMLLQYIPQQEHQLGAGRLHQQRFATALVWLSLLLL
jgi:hypothetical protein